MSKFYRVKKDNFLWDEGAILKHDQHGNGFDGYMPIDDIWNKNEDQNEYITSRNIEKNHEWFERVYPINLLSKTVYKLKEEAKEMMNKEYK